MAYKYCDTDVAAGDSSGDSWVNAVTTMELLHTKMSAGDVGFYQQSSGTLDTLGATRTLTSPGTILQPCKVIGCVAGTTNEGTSVVKADIAVTRPICTTTVAASDIILEGVCTYVAIEFDPLDKFVLDGVSTLIEFSDCKKSFHDDVLVDGTSRVYGSIDCLLEQDAATGAFAWHNDWPFENCVFGASTTQWIESGAGGEFDFFACDFSANGSTNIINAGTRANSILRHCVLGASFVVVPAITGVGSVKVIGCRADAAVTNSESLQNYEFHNAAGIITNSTIVRTGGADDQALGAFSYKFLPTANGSIQGSLARMKSEWLSVWVAGGVAQTISVFVQNNTADLKMNQLWLDAYYPGSGDSSRYTQIRVGDADRFLHNSASDALVADDTGSTWSTVYTYQQKLVTASFTPGYTGWAYCQVNYAPAQGTAVPVMYLDPLPVAAAV